MFSLTIGVVGIIRGPIIASHRRQSQSLSRKSSLAPGLVGGAATKVPRTLTKWIVMAMEFQIRIVMISLVILVSLVLQRNAAVVGRGQGVKQQCAAGRVAGAHIKEQPSQLFMIAMVMA